MVKVTINIENLLGEQSTIGGQVESITQEKFELEKQLSNLNLMLKTITKERDESSVQYQQYAQQLNAQITNLSNRIEMLQAENENLSIQDQNRVKHISELERQLQFIQNEQVAYVTRQNNGDGNLKSELDNTREICIQLQVLQFYFYNKNFSNNYKILITFFLMKVTGS